MTPDDDWLRDHDKMMRRERRANFLAGCALAALAVLMWFGMQHAEKHLWWCVSRITCTANAPDARPEGMSMGWTSTKEK